MFDINGNELLKVILLHTIQDKAVMCKVLETLPPRLTWQDVRDSILKIDSINNLGGAFMAPGKGKLGAGAASV